MSAQRDKDRLDELIFRTINTEKPQFDAEKWKQKYPDEYRTLISRRAKRASSRRPNVWKVIFSRWAARYAAAAAIIVVAGLLLSPDRRKPGAPETYTPLVAQSPAKIITMASMRMAYQRGGMDALDKQLGDALDVLGPRSSSVSIRELLEGSTML